MHASFFVYRNKYTHLKKRFAARRKECKELLQNEHFMFHVHAARANLLEESLQCLFDAKIEELNSGNLRVNYKNEVGDSLNHVQKGLYLLFLLFLVLLLLLLSYTGWN